jgi:hypothetical protein
MARWARGVSEGSFIFKLYRVGDGTEPCGTPACIFRSVEISPSTESLSFLSERNELISLILLAESCKPFMTNRGTHVVSKDFSISMNTVAVQKLLLKFKVA